MNLLMLDGAQVNLTPSSLNRKFAQKIEICKQNENLFYEFAHAR